MPARKLSSFSKRAVTLDEANDSVSEADDGEGIASMPSAGGTLAEGGKKKKKKRKKKKKEAEEGCDDSTNFPGGGAAEKSQSTTPTWITDAVTRGQDMGVFPRASGRRSEKQDWNEVVEHMTRVVQEVVTEQTDSVHFTDVTESVRQEHTEKYLMKLKENYLCDLDSISVLKASDYIHMGFPGGIAECMLRERVGAADMSPEEVAVPVMHTCLLKEITESPDGELFIKCTFVQTQVGLTDELFEFRFNDVSATEDHLHIRRKTHIPNFGIRTTYNSVVPTKKKQVFSMFPFQIYQITTLVELSTMAVIKDNGEFELRPDIRLWSEDERQLALVRGVEELNSTETYALCTGAPKVTMLYDTKKKYCPKYEIGFYLVIPALQAFFSVYMPMLLVTIYTFVNATQDAQSSSQLDNAVAIATVIVFVLPNLNTESKGQDTFGTDELYIVLMFAGLIFTGLVHPSLSEGSCECLFAANRSDPAQCKTSYDVDTTDCQHILAYVGLALLTISNVIPLYHVYQYRAFKARIYSSCYVEEDEPVAKKSRRSSMAKVVPFKKKNSIAPDGTPLPMSNISGRAYRQAFVGSKSAVKWEALQKKTQELNVERLAEMTPCCTRKPDNPDEWEKSPLLDERWRTRTVAGKKGLIKLQCGPDHRAGY